MDKIVFLHFFYTFVPKYSYNYKLMNHLVIMAGGVGSRFWPMSTAEHPKQFIDVLGVGRTLFQLTYDRFEGICAPENVWVVTNDRYAAIVHEQLPEIPLGNILREPCRRNTAPCIAYVSWRIKNADPKANIVVAPSDHIVTNPMEFRRVITACLKFTSESDAIVTLGMKPTRPETGYGYIEADMAQASARNKGIYRVMKFREKPNWRRPSNTSSRATSSGMPHLHLERQHDNKLLPRLSAVAGTRLRPHTRQTGHTGGAEGHRRGVPGL